MLEIGVQNGELFHPDFQMPNTNNWGAIASSPLIGVCFEFPRLSFAWTCHLPLDNYVWARASAALSGHWSKRSACIDGNDHCRVVKTMSFGSVALMKETTVSFAPVKLKSRSLTINLEGQDQGQLAASHLTHSSVTAAQNKPCSANHRREVFMLRSHKVFGKTDISSARYFIRRRILGSWTSGPARSRSKMGQIKFQSDLGIRIKRLHEPMSIALSKVSHRQDWRMCEVGFSGTYQCFWMYVIQVEVTCHVSNGNPFKFQDKSRCKKRCIDAEQNATSLRKCRTNLLLSLRWSKGILCAKVEFSTEEAMVQVVNVPRFV